jgi:membrane-associated phospholipid phosphatase
LLGVHWLTDVVAGLVVGWGWFLLSALVFGGRFQRLGEPAVRVAARSQALQR